MDHSKFKVVMYITQDKNRVISSGCLAILMPKGKERDDYIAHFAIALGVKALEFPNGDHLLYEE